MSTRDRGWSHRLLLPKTEPQNQKDTGCLNTPRPSKGTEVGTYYVSCSPWSSPLEGLAALIVDSRQCWQVVEL